jgi:hypothetical protein
MGPRSPKSPRLLSATLSNPRFLIFRMEGFTMDENAGRPQATNAGNEIALLRERLAFFESFDQVIHDNVSHSSELLRKAAASQEEAHRALASATSQSNATRLAERSRFRELFSTMLDEVTALQGHLERLARRVADTLDDLEADSTPGLSEPIAAAVHSLAANAATSPVAPRPVETTPSMASAGETGDEIAAPPDFYAGEPVAPGVTSEDLDASEPFDETSAEVEPFRAEDFESGDAASAESPQYVTPTASIAHDFASDPPEAGGATILVHGVPRATTALSLKRFLEGLPDVDHVEPREYAEGVLRLLVVGRRPVSLQDLRTWPEGLTLEPINVRADLLEVRLNH